MNMIIHDSFLNRDCLYDVFNILQIYIYIYIIYAI